MQSQPARVKLTALQRKAWLLSAGGVGLDGFDLFIMAVALPVIDEYFGLTPFMMSLVSAAAILGAVAGAGIGGFLTDKFGRKRLYTWDLVGFVVFAVASGFSWDVYSLIAFRFLLGLAVGADYPIAASFSAEYLPNEVRGRWLVGGFSFQAYGMIAGAAVGVMFLTLDQSSQAWRWMLTFGCIPAIAIMIARRTLPETPSYARMQASGQKGPQPSYRELFRRTYLRATVLCAGGWFLLDVMMYGIGLYTPILLTGMGIGTDTADWITRDLQSTKATAALDLLLIVGFWIAIFLVDRVGRLPLQKIGFLGAGAALILLGVADIYGDPLWMVLLGYAVFNLLINAGPNSTTFLVPAEAYPTHLRATGHGFAAAAGKFGAVLGVFLLPNLKEAVGQTSTVIIMGCVGIAGFLLTQFVGFETRDVSITETEHVEPVVLPAPVETTPASTGS
jgi:MFS family permease